MFRKLLDEAQAGDNIGALLRGVQRTEIQRGQCLVKPGSVKCHKKFTAQVYVLTKDEGCLLYTSNAKIFLRSKVPSYAKKHGREAAIKEYAKQYGVPESWCAEEMCIRDSINIQGDLLLR